MNQKGISMSLSAIVMIVLAITILVLMSTFILTKFSKLSSQFQTSVEVEPDPATPDASSPLTLSRYSVETTNVFEVIKASVYNPSDKDWVFRDYWGTYFSGCGFAGDRVCFVNTTDLNCNEKAKDSDCKIVDKEVTSMPGDGCYVIDGDDGDPDCAPNEIKVVVSCDELGFSVSSASKEIKSMNYETFIILLDLPKSAPKEKIYTCSANFVSDSSSTNFEKQLSIYIKTK